MPAPFLPSGSKLRATSLASSAGPALSALTFLDLSNNCFAGITCGGREPLAPLSHMRALKVMVGWV